MVTHPDSSVQPETIHILDESLRIPFVQLPGQVLLARNLSMGAKLVYAVLLRYAWQDGHCFPGQARIAQDLSISERSVRTYLQELRAVSVLAWRQRGLKQSNVYFLLDLRAARLDLPPRDDPGAANSAVQESSTPGAANFAVQERQPASGPERQPAADTIDSALIDSVQVDPDRGPVSKAPEPVPDLKVNSGRPGHEPPGTGSTRTESLPRSKWVARDVPYLDSVITDLSRGDLRDEVHVLSNVTQARHLMAEAGLGDEEAMVREVYRALLRTKQGVGVENRGAYFFRLLREQLKLVDASPPWVGDRPVRDDAS